jgi:hypothetical protein
MIHRNRVLPIPRWLLPLLVLFLVFGHVCELPAYADLAISSHLTGDDHRHAADHHADTSQISCEAVDVVSSTGSAYDGPSHDVAKALPVAGPLPVRFVTSSMDDSKRLPSRPPLFLLFASFLI